jgi:transcriptional regulator with XRE-family HTH domain
VEKICASLVNIQFGERLSSVRRSRRLSQADLGKRIGLSRATIANLEAGNQNVQLHQVYAVAKALDAPIDEFLPAAQAVTEHYTPSDNRDEFFLQHARRQLLNAFGDKDENT